MPEISTMTFRHTFGVNMIRNNIPESVVKQILNCSEKTLRRYARYSEHMVDDVLVENAAEEAGVKIIQSVFLSAEWRKTTWQEYLLAWHCRVKSLLPALLLFFPLILTGR